MEVGLRGAQEGDARHKAAGFRRPASPRNAARGPGAWVGRGRSWVLDVSLLNEVSIPGVTRYVSAANDGDVKN